MENQNEIVNVLGDAAPSETTVSGAHSSFKRGCTSTEDYPSSGRLKSATKNGIIEQIS